MADNVSEEEETYTCCVCNEERIDESSKGDDFPYHPHALQCNGPGEGCRCIQKIGKVCSEECDKKGLETKQFHYPTDWLPPVSIRAVHFGDDESEPIPYELKEESD
jgi:hypothetical protein